MRNLKLVESLRMPSVLPGVQCSSVDYDTGHVYAATGTAIICLDPRSQEIISEVFLAECGILPEGGATEVVGIQHLPDQMSVCAATLEGDIILWNVASQQVECVGNVPSGVTGMAWSPDQELLLLATGQDTLIMMTKDFDALSEMAMQPSEFGEAEFITVGWGKKETQFHGSEGKMAAKKKAQDVSPALPWDDRKPRISWRGDGEYFVVSSITPATGARKLRVWTRECQLHSTSEDLNGLEHALSWKPSGSLIASTQRKPNKHDIVFFEKNGLQHGEFSLPFALQEVKVKEVLWNTESSVLAVWCEELPPEGATDQFTPKSYVQLWTVSNYHWYLKQSLQFSGSQDECVASVTWDPEFAYKLHIVCSGGQYHQYRWAWTTDHSNGHSKDDLAQVAVIDGDCVLVSPFKNMVVPPPMCAYHIKLPSPVSQVAFGPAPQSNDLAVLLADGRIAIYRMDEQGEKRADPSVHLGAAGGSGFKVRCAMPRLAGIFTPGSEGLVEGEYPLKTHHMIWADPLSLLLVSLDKSGHESIIHNIQLEQGEEGALCGKTSWSNAVGGSILAMCRNDDNGSIVIELTDGSLLRLSKGSDCPVPWENEEHSNLSLPQPCTHIASCKIGGQEAVLGLTERYRFYVNDIEICSNCTSFSVHDEFILLSTHAHTCRCISRSLLTKDLPSLCESKAHPFDESVRRVERGSRIVLSVPGDTKLVLQMPRGNLETIHPRALVLSAVRRYLDRLQFKEAFISMRKHRINMNLIYDHNPKLFLENVSNFLQQVESVNYINIFLMDLQEEDVTQSMYTSGYSGRDSNSSGNLGGSTKVDMVCDAVRTSLQALDSDKYFLSILTTYVKRTQPELDAALHRIKQLRDAAAGSKCKVSAEEALKYLLFLVDVNELYDVALGTYDFDLVLMVAEKSQKDPKEYLPYLNNLRRLETNYQRYTIDRHLRRYHKALKHIAKCPDHFPECLSLVNDHQLHSEALQLFAIGSQEYTSIAESYAEKLKKKRHYEEAAIIFVKAGQLQQALDCFVLCHNWRQAMCLTARLGYTQEQVADLARKMAESLADLKRPLEAGALYDEYVQDVELAITTLIEGCQWDEALRLMYKYSRTDFIESNLRTALLENQQLQVSYLGSKRTEFDHHKARLTIVRDEKEKAHLQLLDSGGNFNDADADLFSDTSSATGESVRTSNYSTTSSQRSSQYSRSTGRSSKNRRKEERKKWSLKEGSRFEDLALLDALRKLIIQVDGLRVEFSSLLKALVLFDYDTQAQELQANYRDFLTHIESSLLEIWIPGGQDTAGGAAGNHLSLGPDSTANSISKAIQDGIRNQSTSAAVSDAALLVAPLLAKDIKWQINILNTEKEQ